MVPASPFPRVSDSRRKAVEYFLMPRPRTIITLEQLYATLPAAGPAPRRQAVAAADIPAPAHRLLVHNDHMTEVMERHHGCTVSVEVQERRRTGNHYSRLIRLHRDSDHAIVQGGLVRIHLQLLPADVAAAILAEQVPLGRLLIHHRLLRHIDVRQYLQFPPQPALEAWLGPMRFRPTYGRLGYLHVGLRPAIDLFEILAPASLAGANAL
jgi:chorismate-pyruvate lyase